MIRHVVFDFDGTLVESNEIKRGAFREIAERFPGGLDAMEAVQNDGLPQDRYSVFSRFAARVSSGDCVLETGEDLARLYTGICEERISLCPFCPGGEEVIGRLRDLGLKVYLNSATPESALRPILERRGMLGLFDDLRGLPPGKTENLLDLMERNGAKPSDTVVVGDGKDDKASAEAAGCHFVSSGCGRGGFDLLTLADLPAALARLSEPRHAQR